MYSTQSHEKLAKDQNYPRNFIWEEVTPKSTKVQTLGEKPRACEYICIRMDESLITDGLGAWKWGEHVLPRVSKYT